MSTSNSDALYINLETGRSVGGYFDCQSGIVHICPFANSFSTNMFYCVAGHELIHAYQYNILGDKINWTYSEYVAYRYSYRMCNNVQIAFSFFVNAVSLSYWGTAPAEYTLPPNF